MFPDLTCLFIEGRKLIHEQLGVKRMWYLCKPNVAPNLEFQLTGSMLNHCSHLQNAEIMNITVKKITQRHSSLYTASKDIRTLLPPRDTISRSLREAEGVVTRHKSTQTLLSDCGSKQPRCQCV